MEDIKIEIYKETEIKDDKDIFYLGEVLKKLNEMCNGEEDPDKVMWLCNEIERVEEIEQKAYEYNAEQIAKKLEAKEKAYNAKSFGPESDAYGILKWLTQCADESKNTFLRTDDFGYGENWKKEIPEWYLKDTDDDHKLLDRYYEAMGDLEELFHHLAYFTEDVSYHFPEQRLFIKFDKYTFEFNYITGQGSDFSISVVEKARPEAYKEHPIRLVIDYEKAVELSKASAYQQALYYANEVLEVPQEDLITTMFKTMFILGQATARVGFLDFLNKDNFDKRLENL